jgi:galactose mutarotase-like enzyme
VTTTISNNFISATIKHVGAELCSLKKINNDREYIWRGNPEFWGKHSPILFPIIGTLKNNQYKYNKQEYSLPRHGFARDNVFTIFEKKENSITFSLKFSAETIAIYPFQFELQIRYTLVDYQLYIGYKVINLGPQTMAFSIGAHPAFALNEQFESYALQFEKAEELVSYVLEDNLLSDKTKIIENEAGIIPLQYSLFDNDALVFKSIASKSLTISENNKPMLKINFEEFPNLGIWTVNRAPFICIEPWFGYSDTAACAGNIMEKEGIQLLEGRTTFTTEYFIELL